MPPVIAGPAGTVGALPEVPVTGNQAKVIRDKYLRDAPSIAAWLHGVASNIALAEVLHVPGLLPAVVGGLSVEVRETEACVGERARAILVLDPRAKPAAREAAFDSYLARLAALAASDARAAEVHRAWTERFFGLLSRFDFLPNSPTLMNAGRRLQQLSACYVLPVGDSLEEITDALKAQALIHKSGGGTGFSFGRLRPAGDLVGSTCGVASGAVSFMQVFDKMTEVVKQGGTRRGANMGILPYHHPEILSFVRMKLEPGVMENFNISVSVDDRFMRAARARDEVALVNPRTGESAGAIDAGALLDTIAACAWRTGDPGLVFIDRVNASGSNPTPALGPIEATNPCGEQPLLPNEPCNLGSLNIARFVAGPVGSGRLESARLEEAVDLAMRFLDDVIDVNRYPLPEVEAMAKGNRRVGLGVMGWAEALVRLGLPYDSEEALAAARDLMRRVDERALLASEALARERGLFPHFAGSIYDERGPHLRRRARPRNCARTTIAPTGTIAIAAGLQGSGIEPFFGIAYTRYTAAGLDALKRGEAPAQDDVFFEQNPLFREVAAAHGLFGLSEEELWRRVSLNHRSVRGLDFVPERVQRLFPTSHDIAVEMHVRMQAAFQEHTDNAVSKTVNLPHRATVEDVRRAYLLAHELGCKGITVYRDGSKGRQVLSLEAPPCPTCSGRNVRYDSGCTGVTCYDCGFSACA